MDFIRFAFIVALPLLVVAGAVVSLFAIGAVFDALDDPGALRARVEGLFRRPPRPPREVGKDHYYRPHWAGKS